MSKVEVQTLSPQLRQQLLDELTVLLFSLQDRSSAQQFLFTFLSSSEIVMVARRLRAARDLLRGHSIRAVTEKHRIGLSTVRIVDRSLSKLLPAYRSSVPRLLTLPEAARARGLARLRKRSPLLALIFHDGM